MNTPRSIQQSPSLEAKVLLVDDDISVHAALSGVLRDAGSEVIDAFDGNEAIRKFQAAGGVDIVLLDLSMPVKTGWDTFERLTSINPLLPIIIVTGQPDQETLAAAAGAGALMEKPIEIPELLKTMQELLAESPEQRLARIAQGS